MYDYLLGGRQNFDVDRLLADEAIRQSPGMATAVSAFRDLLRRTVQYCNEPAAVAHGRDLPTAEPRTDGSVARLTADEP